MGYTFCIGLLRDFKAARRLKKRSLLNVNEHFSGKVDAKISNTTMQNLTGCTLLCCIVELF